MAEKKKLKNILLFFLQKIFLFLHKIAMTPLFMQIVISVPIFILEIYPLLK